MSSTDNEKPAMDSVKETVGLKEPEPTFAESAGNTVASAGEGTANIVGSVATGTGNVVTSTGEAVAGGAQSTGQAVAGVTQSALETTQSAATAVKDTLFGTGSKEGDK